MWMYPSVCACQQAFETAHYIRLTRRSPLCILMGDLNVNPSSKAYQVGAVVVCVYCKCACAYFLC